MATNFNENSIVSSGGFKPSSKDTPLDIRTRVETEQDIYEIPNPYIGMIVYVKDTGKRFEILTLKEIDTGLTTKNVVDTYKQFTVDLEEYAKIEDVPTKVSELENDKGYLVNQDISGKADAEDIPTKVSELENDRGYATERFVDSKIETINNTVNSNTNTINSKINTINSNINTINTEIDNINTDLTNVSENIEGSWISVDSKDGYLKDVEILGNTIQNQDNLANIRSVGDKLENQELYEIPVLSTGKNLIKCIDHSISGGDRLYLKVNLNKNTDYRISSNYEGVFEYRVVLCEKQLDSQNRAVEIKQLNVQNERTFNTESNFGELYILFHFGNAYEKYQNNNINIQIEKGTQSTPYEPYVEDKLTILSPTPLEKVGDVADRIICKDGVWGIEKNIETFYYNGSENWQTYGTTNGVSRYYLKQDDILFTRDKQTVLSNKYNYNPIAVDGYKIGIQQYSDKLAIVCNIVSHTEFKESLKDGLLVKAVVTQPQFIPLPYNQQIKLRTFANKTNISFGCEIEPTLKAQVPKSIGASVNTHSEQIDNLYDEIDKIKKLEESTVSTVTTESDFTTVEQTSNGYFEDVKLEGKTLVNLCGDCIGKNNNAVDLTDNIVTFSGTSGAYWLTYDASLLKPNTTYTLIMLGINIQSPIKCDLYPDNFPELGEVNVDSPINVYKFTTPDNLSTLNGIRYFVHNGVTATATLYSPIILEGDHTQNPPEYFEGIKSVGDGVDDITIVTTNAPMFFGKGGKK